MGEKKVIGFRMVRAWLQLKLVNRSMEKCIKAMDAIIAELEQNNEKNDSA